MACDLVNPAFLQYEQELLGFLQKRLKDPSASQEVLAEVLLKVHKNCEKLPEVKNIRAWLFSITRNALTDYWRNQKPQLGLEEVVLQAPEEEEPLYGQLENLLPQMINCLPAEYAQPLILSDLDGLPQQQIADQLGLSLSGAKSRIQRARKMLRDQFFACLHLEPDERGVPQGYAVKPHCSPLLKEPVAEIGPDCCEPALGQNQKKC